MLIKYLPFLSPRVKEYASRSQDYRICSKIFKMSLSCLVLCQVSLSINPIPAASVPLEILNAIAIGLVSSYAFFLGAIIIPRTTNQIRKIEIAHKHIRAFETILNSVSYEIEQNFWEVDGPSFVEQYVRDNMSRRPCSIQLSNHLGGWENTSCRTLSSFILRLAQKVQYSCPIIHKMGGDGKELYDRIEHVQYIAFELLNPHPDAKATQDLWDKKHPGLLLLIRYMIAKFYEVHESFAEDRLK